MSNLVNGYMGEAVSEDGKYASYNLNKEHLIAIEVHPEVLKLLEKF